MKRKEQPALPASVIACLTGFVEGAGLPYEVVDELVNRHLVVTHLPGAVLFNHGSPGDIIFCILSGFVDVLSPGEPKPRLIQVCGPGDLCGCVYSNDEAGRRIQALEARARTACDIALVTRGELSRLLHSLDNLTLIKLLEYINSSWSASIASWTTLIGQSYRSRLMHLLQDLATRFGVEDASGIIISPELKQSELAQMIGSSRATVSELIDEMTRDGIVERRATHYVLLRRPTGGQALTSRDS